MGSNLGGHNTGAKAVRSEKTRPVLGMKDGSRLGSSLASALAAFASVGVDGACSFSIAGGAAVLLLGSKGSNVLLLLGSKQGLERAPNPHANYTAGPPLAGGIPGRARGLGPRDIEARAGLCCEWPSAGGGLIKAH